MFNKKLYPPYWKMFSEYIRFERAGNKCERCGVDNGFYKGYLDIKALEDEMAMHPDKTPFDLFIGYTNGGYLFSETNDFGEHGWLIKSVTKIVLTVAHLDHRGGVCQCKRFFGFKCAKPSHVQALCQGCHLALDRPKHMAVQKRNRELKKDAQRALLQLV